METKYKVMLSICIAAVFVIVAGFISLTPDKALNAQECGSWCNGGPHSCGANCGMQGSIVPQSGILNLK